MIIKHSIHRVLFMLMLVTWVLAKKKRNICVQRRGTCVPENNYSCINKADYPGCKEDEICCKTSRLLLYRGSRVNNRKKCKKQYRGVCRSDCRKNEIHRINCNKKYKCCGCKIKSSCKKNLGHCIVRGDTCDGQIKKKGCRGKKCACCIPDNPATAFTTTPTMGELTTTHIPTEDEYCEWDRNVHFPEYRPLLFDSSSQMILPILKDCKNITRVKKGDNLTIACPGTKFINKKAKVTNVIAICNGGQSLMVNGSNTTLKDLGCKMNVAASDQQSSSQENQCGDNAIEVFIGFKIKENSFYKLIRVCFNTREQTTTFSENTIRGANLKAEELFKRPKKFKYTEDPYFTNNMSKIYTKENQMDIARSLQIAKVLDFNKGHLAPAGDFVLAAEKRASFYFINVVPQWISFNNGSWVYLENAIRELAKDRRTDLTIFTGGWKVLELNDTETNLKKIYLGHTENNTEVVPAPHLMWKIVYDKKKNEAVAFVGINNIYIEKPPEKSELICRDICANISWVNMVNQREDLTKGYIYCCEIQTFKQTINYNISVPDDVNLLDKLKPDQKLG